jgi:beta-lactamase regulating signal transducer with metallopeptidase domain
MDIVIEQINSVGKRFVEFAWPMLWQASVLIAILLGADWLLRRKVRAVFRYWLWMLVLAKLFLPTTLSSPMSIGLLTGNALPAINIAATEQPVGGDISNVLPNSPRTAEIAEASVALHAETPIQSQAVTPVASLTRQGGIFLVWLMVVCAMLLLLMQRAVFVCGLVRQSAEATGLMTDALKFCCNQMGVRQTIGLKVSPNATSPAVCGLFRPVILVPQGLGPSLGINSLRVVLMHELAHIKRGDLWVNLLQTVLQIAYFYNPLLWLANWVIRRVREQAVDEAVQVALGERASQYPETLLNVARLAFERPALSLRLIGVVESKSALTSRIKRMLTRPIPKTAKLGIIGSVAVILFAAILLPMAKAAPPPEFVIKGTITDAQTGKPIAGAKVADTERYDEGKHGAVTDSNGDYSYKTWYEEHGVKAEADGYKRQDKGFETKFLGSEKEKVIDFSLEPAEPSEKTDYSSVIVTEGVGFDSFIVGDANCTGEFIKSKLGEPDKETKNEQQGWWIAYHEKYGLDFWLNLREKRLYEIRLNKGFKGKLSSGISMSSTKQDVFAVYGQPLSEKTAGTLSRDFSYYENRVLFYNKNPDSGESRFSKIYYSDKGILFWFDSDKINQIVIYPPVSNKHRVVGIGPGWQKLQRVIGDNYGGSIGGYSNDEQKCGEYFEQVLSWAKPGDTFVMMFAFDEEKFGHSQMVPQKYQDMLPKPWQEIKEQIERGEVLELKGKARGLDIIVLAAPTLEQLEELIKSTELLQPFKTPAVKTGPEGLRIYEVNRMAAEFSEKEDFSTPEAAYASINRVSASGEPAGWQRVSVKELAAKLAEENKTGRNKVEPEWAKVLLNTKIIEVRICDSNIAVVFAELPQEFTSKPIQKPIDVRHLKLEDGKWLNAGNDRVWTIEEARTEFDSLCKDKKTDGDDKKAMNPPGWTIAAAEFGDTNGANAGKENRMSKPKKAGPPVVVKTTPEAFANDVSSDLNNLTVTFNQQMKDKSWAWVQWDAPYPETTGQPYYDNEKKTCSLPVKLKAGQAYLVAFNVEPYIGFLNSEGKPAKSYVLVFATKSKDGKPTPIPEELIAKAKSINDLPQEISSEAGREESKAESVPYTQITYDDIRPDGTIFFKNTIREINRSNREITSKGFINSDFVHVTGMSDDEGRALEFKSTHDGNIYRYEVTFNKPIPPGQVVEYASEGTVDGLVKPVPDSEGTFQYYMKHWPAAGQPTRRVETYLLPAGAELISTTPKDMERRTKDGRIELHVEKMIPPDGSITTSFQYRVP